MKLYIIPCLALILASSAFLRADNFPFNENFSRTCAFSPTGKITIENVDGDVEVGTWDKNEILIEGEKRAKTDEELKLIELTIEVSKSDAAIKVRLPKQKGSFGNNIRASVSFKITVPATASLEKLAVVNAAVRINDLRGSVSAESVNGGIHAHHLSGSVELGTVNGEIEAEITSVTSGQKLSFHTVNGSIAVRLPADKGADTHASVVNGSINCDFPLTVHGHIVGKNLSGKIGDGRAALSAESVNGSIRFKTTTKPVASIE